MPDAARKVFDEELAKLLSLKPSAQEYNLTTNYLDWLSLYPWGKTTAEQFTLTSAERVLDEDHYGMRDVKDRIMEFIAVAKLRKTV